MYCYWYWKWWLFEVDSSKESGHYSYLHVSIQTKERTYLRGAHTLPEKCLRSTIMKQCCGCLTLTTRQLVQSQALPAPISRRRPVTLESQKQMLMSRSKWGEEENESQHTILDCCGMIVDWFILHICLANIRTFHFRSIKGIITWNTRWIQYSAQQDVQLREEANDGGCYK